MFIRRCRFLGIASLVFFVCSVPKTYLNGQVFLDYSAFETRLGELTTAAGVTAFSAGEVDTIKANIKSSLETSFAGFTGITFTEVDPGGTRPELVFGLLGGGLGVADHIDFLNTDLGDTARVFTASFTFSINEFTGSTDRADQISQLSAALSGTAAHELGHNLGLRHHDAHGDITFEGTLVNTGGNEDTHIMATGSTGLSEAQRETQRTFSTNSLVKLAYADTTLAGGNPTAINESGDAGGTLVTAQKVAFETIPVANRFGEVVLGSLNANNDVDLYEIELVAGSVLTVDINNDFAQGAGGSGLDTIIELLDSTGTTIYTNDDTRYSTTEFGPGVSFRDTDSILYNASIANDGTHYIRITSFNAASSGVYQLLVHTDISAIPEPASGLLVLATCGAVMLRRRRRKNRT